MAKEQTLSIIKPDATQKNVIGKILTIFEDAGLKIVAGKMMSMRRADAEQFYSVHRERPFFGELCDYMCSGPVFVTALEGTDAVALNRKLMGATDPKKADAGTIRALYGDAISANAVHGSDSLENAKTEIGFFFPDLSA